MQRQLSRAHVPVRTLRRAGGANYPNCRLCVWKGREREQLDVSGDFPVLDTLYVAFATWALGCVQEEAHLAVVVMRVY